MWSVGWAVNLKRVYRLYSEEDRSIRAKLPRRKRAWRYQTGRPTAGRSVSYGVDCCSREGLATVPRANFRTFHVVEVLDRLFLNRGKPKTR